MMKHILCNYENNPHIDKSKPLHCYPVKNIPRILKSNFPQKKYTSRKEEKHSAVHWGQRKLLMSEIEFLLIHADYKPDKNIIVIYAGGAPGDHIPFLSNMFPHILFILIDPSKFNIKPSNKIIIIKDFMTNQLSHKLFQQYNNPNNHLLFISDVRSVDFRLHNLQETETQIQNDMNMQQEWYKILKPNAGMLKFRLPWIIDNNTPTTTNYLAGDIHFPIYGARTTTETRLIVKGDGTKMKKYNNQKYESQMYHFNTETRNNVFIHDVKANGLDCCYDCATEVFLLQKYFDKYINNGQDRNLYVGNLIDTITRQIGNGHRNLENWQKKNEFKKRIIDINKGKIFYISSRRRSRAPNRSRRTRRA